jgi:hypothetical protein
MQYNKTISFISERHQYVIPLDEILYVMMKKQDAYIHTADGKILKTRMTFAEVEEALGDDFIRLNRGCLVSAMAVYNIEKQVILNNGEALNYSAARKKEILEKFQKKQKLIVEMLSDKENPADHEEYHEYYKCFDNIPIAFADIEMVFDEENRAVDWIFRYGNEALAQLENCTLEELIGNRFGSIFDNMDQKWLRSYEHSTIYGETLEIIDYSPEIDKYLRVISFPTFKGHCGCMLFDISKTKISGEKTAADNAVLMYLKKMMEI